MKIAFFLDMAKELGGAGNLLLQQAVLMSEIHDVIVVIPTDENGVPNQEYAERCRANQVPYIGLYYRTAFNFRNIDLYGAIESADAVEEFTKRERIDFFHSVQLNAAVEYVSRKQGIPHLMNIYQLSEEEFSLCPGDIYAHYHLCDSQLYSNRWKRKLGIESMALRPVAPLKEMKLKDRYTYGSIKILMLGDVNKRKNQVAAIRSVEKCVKGLDHEIELHIAGYNSGPYADECVQYVREHSLDNIVFFHGFLSDVVPMLECCDCLLCTSIDESFPSSMVEALTYDLTIISTPVAGVPEVFIDEDNAFISMDFSEESIIESLLKCLEYYKNGKISEIHSSAAKTWRKCFKRESIKNSLDLYYKRIERNYKQGDAKIFELLLKDLIEVKELLSGIKGVSEHWIYAKGLYLLTIKNMLSRGEIYIWGAGNWGKLTMDILMKLCPDLKIVAFIDISKEGMISGIPIIKPNEVIYGQSLYYSVSFNSGREQAIDYLENRGLVLYKQVWIIP